MSAVGIQTNNSQLLIYWSQLFVYINIWMFTWQLVYSIIQFDLGLWMRPSLMVTNFNEYSEDKDNPLATLTWTPRVIEAEVQ